MSPVFLQMRQLANAYAPMKTVAEAMAISPQYLSDILNGRRALSPKLVTAFCAATESQDIERKWHRAAAREQGWKI